MVVNVIGEQGFVKLNYISIQIINVVVFSILEGFRESYEFCVDDVKIRYGFQLFLIKIWLIKLNMWVLFVLWGILFIVVICNININDLQCGNWIDFYYFLLVQILLVYRI